MCLTYCLKTSSRDSAMLGEYSDQIWCKCHTHKSSYGLSNTYNQKGYKIPFCRSNYKWSIAPMGLCQVWQHNFKCNRLAKALRIMPA